MEKLIGTEVPRNGNYKFYKNFTDFFLIVSGILCAGFGLKGFLLPTGFIDGGVTGISLLVNRLSHIPIYILLFLINIPFIILGYSQVSRAFAVKTFLAIIGLGLCLIFINYPVVTADKTLVSVFAGFFLGAGSGLAIRGGCVIDGTEVLALFTSKKTGLTVGDVILAINIIIFSFAAWLLNIEVALYSILVYLAASKTVDFVIQGIEEYTGVTIISENSEDIRMMIINSMKRGVTIYKGKRGFGKKGDTGDIDVVFTVVTRLELTRLKNEIEKIDRNAFLVMHSINDTRGGMVKKRRLRESD